MSHILGFLP
jgi:hypothetical protein